MRILSAIGLAMAAMLAGCSSSGNAIKARIDATTLSHAVGEEGWRVDCLTDHHKAETRCFAGSFDQDGRGAFQMVYLNGKGPILYTPNDFPGRVATVRVDNGPVIPETNARGIVEALKVGKVAYVIYHRWPSGEEKMTVDVRGFAEAYQVLLTKL
jgi:hypothetical protein